MSSQPGAHCPGHRHWESHRETEPRQGHMSGVSLFSSLLSSCQSPKLGHCLSHPRLLSDRLCLFQPGNLIINEFPGDGNQGTQRRKAKHNSVSVESGHREPVCAFFSSRFLLIPTGCPAPATLSPPKPSTQGQVL